MTRTAYLLDDDYAQVTILSKILTPQGFNCTNFQEPDEFLGCFTNLTPDVAVIDYRLDNKTCEETVLRARKINTKALIIVISAGPISRPSTTNLYMSGANNVLGKDHTSFLSEIIERHFRVRSSYASGNRIMLKSCGFSVPACV